MNRVNHMNQFNSIVILLLLMGEAAYAKVVNQSHNVEKNIKVSTTKTFDLEQLAKGLHEVEISDKITTCRIKICIKISEVYTESYEHQSSLGIIPNVKNKNKIKWMKIYYGKNLLYLPITAYNQLGYIRKAELILELNNLKLIIYGGNTGDAYVCELIFDKNRLRKKILRPLNDMMPPASEITIYRADAIDNPKLID